MERGTAFITALDDGVYRLDILLPNWFFRTFGLICAGTQGTGTGGWQDAGTRNVWTPSRLTWASAGSKFDLRQNPGNFFSDSPTDPPPRRSCHHTAVRDSLAGRVDMWLHMIRPKRTRSTA